MKKKLFIKSIADTQKVGNLLAITLMPQDVITLRGDLGAGKTELARSIITSLIGKNETVPSPTFTIVQTYETSKGTLSHYDLYRLNSPEEAEELGLEETLFTQMVIIEWPEKLGPKKFHNNLDIEITLEDLEKHYFTFSGNSRWKKFIDSLSNEI